MEAWGGVRPREWYTWETWERASIKAYLREKNALAAVEREDAMKKHR